MFSDPLQNLNQLNLKPNDIVADFGAGSGAYTLACARIVRNGKVYAIEVQKDLLMRLKDEAILNRLNNIEVIWGNIEKVNGSKLANDSVDVALVSNVLFQTDDKNGLIREVYRVLKTGGRVLVIDWTDSFGGMGPNPSQIFSKSFAQDLFERNGFTFVKSISAGVHHYGIILVK